MKKNARMIFNEIANQNQWGSAISRSGPGSETMYCFGIIRHLPDICQEFGVNTLLDAPCGDLNWIAPLLPELPIDHYIGLDVADTLEPEIQRKISSANKKMKAEVHFIDIVAGPLPPGDLILIKDLLQHLSHERIRQLLRTIANSDIRFALISNYYKQKNSIDIEDGGARYIDLSAAPYNFPKEIYRVEEQIEDPERWSRWYGLWSREQIQAVADRLAQ